MLTIVSVTIIKMVVNLVILELYENQPEYTFRKPEEYVLKVVILGFW